MLTTKKCSKCGEVKQVSEYYKCNASKDGLQSQCKICQAESNKKIQQKKRLQKRNTQLKRFSEYHLHKGLKYKLKGPQKKGSNRQEVVYNCLDCGKEVQSTLELAWVYKFKCDDCRLKGVTKPLFYTISTDKKNQKNQKLYKKLNSSCNCHNSCNEECKNKSEINTTPLEHSLDQDNSCNVGFKFDEQNVRVIVIPMFDSSQIKQNKQNRFIKWLKSLFGR